MNADAKAFHLDMGWADVAFYQSLVRRMIYPQNRREILAKLTEAAIKFDRLERRLTK